MLISLKNEFQVSTEMPNTKKKRTRISERRPLVNQSRALPDIAHRFEPQPQLATARPQARTRNVHARVFALVSVIGLIICLQLLPLAASVEAAEPGCCDWSGDFWAGDLDGEPRAFAVFDDGTGPALYAAGSFQEASGIPVAGIARWDGANWSPLVGPHGFGIDGTANALAAYDDGTGDALYVGGFITAAGGIPVNNIARWDGSSWTPVEGVVTDGVDGYIVAMTTFDDGAGAVLVVGGWFEAAGGVTANNIARWGEDGWLPLAGPGGIGTDDDVYALVVHNDGSGPALYAGGQFILAGGLLVNRVARWNSSGWSALGDAPLGVSGTVYSLASYTSGGEPGLYAGGQFQSAGGIDASRIAVWRLGSWSPVGAGISGSEVNTMKVFNDGSGAELYVGGKFNAAGPIEANSIVRWDGTEWRSLPGVQSDSGYVWVGTLHVFEDGEAARLYAGGRFVVAGDTAVNRIASWDGATWSRLDPRPWHGLPSTGHLPVHANGAGNELIVANSLIAGTDFTQGLARWNGYRWAPLGGPHEFNFH